MTQRWAIIGGGMMGLTLALRLAQAHRHVTLFEAGAEIGGLAAAWSLDDVTWDKHYHVTLLSDAWTRGILRELDLDDQVHWVTTRTGFYAADRVSPLSSAIDYLRLPTLGPISKARLAATILYAARIRNWRPLEQVPVECWLRKLSGNRTFEQLWRPLLKAKLGDGYRDAAATFIWATIQRLYAARRTGLKREMLGYVPGGYATTLAHFADKLADLDVNIRLNAGVEGVERTADGLRLTAAGVTEHFDQVILTTTPARAASVCRDLPPDERNRLAAIDYQGVVCAAVLLDRPLSDYYLTYLTAADLPITAVVDMTAFVDPAQFGGRGLVYLPRYAHRDEPIFTLGDEEIRTQFLDALARIYPSFDTDQVQCFRVSRARDVFPLPSLGYSTRLPGPSTSVPGLHIVSSAHIINGTLNVNDTVRVAEWAAAELIRRDGAPLPWPPEDAA